MGEKQVLQQKSDSFLVAAFLAVSGGVLEAYTYLCRGQVFANAQTGNIALLGVRMVEGNWIAAGRYLIPILAFSLGVLVAEIIKIRHRSAGRIHWRHTVLLMEMGVLVGASCIPLGEWDAAVNVLISFVCALQVESFRKVQGHPFTSTMCTGNLRSSTEMLFYGMVKKDRELMRRSGYYFGIILFFLMGAALGGLLAHRFPQRAVLAATVFQLGAFLWMYGEKVAG